MPLKGMTMRIGAVAEALGIASSAIRYYERKGLIRPIGRVAGRRELDQQTILNLRFLKLAQSAGFTLAEVQQLLEFGFGDARQQDDWLAFLRSKRSAVKDQMEDLRRMDKMLRKFESCTCTSLNDCMGEPTAVLSQASKS